MTTTTVARRWTTRLGLALAIALLGGAAAVQLTAAKKPSCYDTIAGTYYKPAGGIFNLSRDGTITGSLSETSQFNAGQGDTFLGMWRCATNTITGHDYRFVNTSPTRQLSRTDWHATFSPAQGGTLTIHFEFARVPETASAIEARTAPATFDDDIVAIRVAAP
ncbi:MAG TPA: hypothetical protein VNL94_05240 [Candidatus Binatia bacterium]|nr:hypothetical protein [Candidatus Binatia bacterium]